MSSPALLSDVVDDVLDFGVVAASDNHLLKHFRLTNTTDSALDVKLSSDPSAGSAEVAFQLTNENLREGEDTPNEDFNQLFNMVNLVTNVLIGPHETVRIIVTFRPDVPTASDVVVNKSGTSTEVSVATAPRFTITPVEGCIVLSAFRCADMDTDADIVCKLLVAVKSQVCRSVLRAEVSEVMFSDCTPEGTYHRDVTLWNLSEIPLTFSINVPGMQAKILEFAEYETGKPVSRSTVPGLGLLRVRITFRPQVVGEFDCTVQFENDCDSRNSDTVRVQAVVTAEARGEGLEVNSEELDFGDCLTGVATSRLLRVRNVTMEPLHVLLSTDRENAVAFNLHTEIEDQDGSSDDEDGDDEGTVHPRQQLSVPVGDQNVDGADGRVSGTPSNAAIDSNEAGDAMTTLPRNSKRAGALDKQATDATTAALDGSGPGDDLQRRIDALDLLPGQERSIIVWFKPLRDPEVPDATAGRLRKEAFRIVLKAWMTGENEDKKSLHSHKLVHGLARTCTSLISSSVQIISFGEVAVGSSKMAGFRVQNLSDLPTKVMLHFHSKILTVCTPSKKDVPVAIGPRGYADFQMELIPVRINPDYSKQVTVINLLNRSNDIILSANANSLDRNRVFLHSLFYQLNCDLHRSSSANLIDFGTLVTNSPMVRTFTIKNVTTSPLQLMLEASIPDLAIYKERVNATDFDFTASPAQVAALESTGGALASLPEGAGNSLIDSFRESRENRSQTIAGRASFGVDGETEVGPADSKAAPSDTVKEGSHDSFNQNAGSFGSLANLVASFERGENSTASAPYFPRAEDERDFISSHQQRWNELNQVIGTLLVPVEVLVLAPEGECTVYVVATLRNGVRDGLGGKVMNIEESLLIQLGEHDQSVLSRALDLVSPTVTVDNGTSSDDEVMAIPKRKLPVIAKACTSIMEIAQKNINFGPVTQSAGQTRSKKLLLINNSEVPLLYVIKKSLSFASTAITFPSAPAGSILGVVNPYGRKNIDFCFDPKLPGKFEEKLSVQNVQNPDNTEVVTIKANVRRRETFTLSPSTLDFGNCLLDERSSQLRLVLTNTTNKTRSFELKIPEREGGCGTKRYRVRVSFQLEATTAASGLNPEEEIEKLERKLKICERKNRTAKVVRLKARLAELHRGEGAGEAASPDASSIETSPLNSDTGESSGSDAEGDIVLRRRNPKSNPNCIVFTVAGKGVQTILASLHAFIPFQSDPTSPADDDLAPEHGSGVLVAHEGNNEDFTRSISFSFAITTAPAPHQKEVSMGVLMGKIGATDAAPEGDASKGSCLSVATPVIEWKDAVVNEPITDKLVLRNTGSVEISFLILRPKGDKKGTGGDRSGTSDRHNVVNSPTASPVLATSEETAPSSSASLRTKHKCQFMYNEGVGKLPPFGTETVSFTMTPLEIGRQTHQIIVRDLTKNTDFVVSVTGSAKAPPAVAENFIQMPDLQGGLLDFGDCFLKSNPDKFMKIAPFRIQSLSSNPLVLSMRSNLTNQILAYSDRDLSQPADNVSLPPMGQVTVFICMVSPIEVKRDKNKPLDTSHLFQAYRLGVCREVFGGVFVKVSSISKSDALSSLFEESFKIRASIGMSIARITPKTLDFGQVSGLGQVFSKTFTIANMTERLPLSYSIEPSPGLTITTPSGHLDGLLSFREDPEGVTTHTITVSIRADALGLVERHVIVTHANAPSGPQRVVVRMFVHDGSVDTVSLAPSDPDAMNGEIPSIILPGLYAVPVTTPSNVSLRVASDSQVANASICNDALQRPWLTENSVQHKDRLEWDQFSEVSPSSHAGQFIIVNTRGQPIVLRAVSSMQLTVVVLADKQANLSQPVVEFHGPLSDPAPLAPTASTMDGEDDTPGVLLNESSKQATKKASVSISHLCRGPVLVRSPAFLVPANGRVCMGISMRSLGMVDVDCRGLLLDGKRLPFAGRLMFQELRCEDPMAIMECLDKCIDGTWEEIELQSKDLLESGDPIRGAVNGVDANWGRIVHVIEVTGWVTMTRGHVEEPMIDVGRVGHCNGWLDAPFALTVKNDGENPLVFGVRLVDVPCVISLQTDGAVLGGSVPLATGRASLSTGSSLSPIDRNRKPDALRWGNTETSVPIAESNSPIAAPERADDGIQEPTPDIVLWSVCKGESIRLHGLLRTEQLPELDNPKLQLTFPFINAIDPISSMPVTIAATVTARGLEFGRLSDQCVELPPLVLPPAEDAPPCDKWFVIRNISGETLPLTISVNVTEGLEQLASLGVLHRHSDAPLESCSLAPGEKLEIRVRMRGSGGGSGLLVPNEWPNMFRSDSPIQLAVISLRSKEYPAESVPILGTLQVGSTFSVSSTELDFVLSRASDMGSTVTRAAATQVVVLANRSSLPLHFETQPVPAPGYPESSMVCEPSAGVVAPHGKMPLEVSVASVIGHLMAISNISTDTWQLGINDTGAKDNEISVKIVLFGSGDDVEQSDSTMFTPRPLRESGALSILSDAVLTVRGCMEIAGSGGRRFEINVGQQTRDSANGMEWQLALENASPHSLGFSVHSVHPEDSQWLEIAANIGTLPPNKESHQLTLKLSRANLGIFSTYICITNQQNPSDLKIVRVSMEVVASHRRGPGGDPPLFLVYVDGKSAGSGPSNVSLNLGDLHYGRDYQNRSFVISNTATIPLEFLLTSNIAAEERSELNFASTSSSSKTFRSVKVEPGASTRVSLYIRPRPLLDAENNEKLIRRVLLVEVYVNCRLVKDYQEVVVVRAVLCPTTLGIVDSKDVPVRTLSFQAIDNSGLLSTTKGPSKDDVAVDVRVEPAASDLRLCLVSPNVSSCRYAVCTLMQYILCDIPAATATTAVDMDDKTHVPSSADSVTANSKMFVRPICLNSGEEHSISFRPNIPVLERKWRQLQKSKRRSVEDRIIFYNYDNLSEKIEVTAVIALEDQAPPVASRDSLPFAALEPEIVTWLRQYSILIGRTIEDVNSATTNPEDTGTTNASAHYPSVVAHCVGSHIVLDPEWERVALMLHFLVDELISYGLGGGGDSNGSDETGSSAFQLASLLFGALFHMQPFCNAISRSGESVRPGSTLMEDDSAHLSDLPPAAMSFVQHLAHYTRIFPPRLWGGKWQDPVGSLRNLASRFSRFLPEDIPHRCCADFTTYARTGRVPATTACCRSCHQVDPSPGAGAL